MSITLKAKAAIIENKTILSPAFLTIDNGKIARVSSSALDSQVLDLGDMILFPGFVNAHCHLELTTLQPIPPAPFVEWVPQLMSQKAAQTSADIVDSVKLGTQKLLNSGVTTIFDHISPNSPLQAFENLDISVIGFLENIGLQLEKALEIYQHLITLKTKSPIPLFISPHAFYTLHPEAFVEIITAQKKNFSIHLHEFAEEREYFTTQAGPLFERLKIYGIEKGAYSKTPTSFLKEKNIRLNSTLFIHANDLQNEDLDYLASLEKVCVVHCPGSFDYFGYSGFPFEKLNEYQIPVALGTDSLSSNFDLNYLSEIQRFLKHNPCLDFWDLLPLLTTNAARALDLENVGQIAPGFVADVIGFDFSNEDSPFDLLKRKSSADFVMAKGQILKNNF